MSEDYGPDLEDLRPARRKPRLLLTAIGFALAIGGLACIAAVPLLSGRAVPLSFFAGLVLIVAAFVMFFFFAGQSISMWRYWKYNAVSDISTYDNSHDHS